MRYAVGGLAVLVALLLAPFASACADAGGPLAPGDYILISDHSCSLAFVLVDENGVYFATAGHCVKVDQKVLDKDNKLVGVGAFHYLVPETGSEQDGAPGDDFALIRVDPSIYDRITPTVCGWGGPKGLYEDKPGSGGVKHYGHGVVFGDISQTQARQGYNLDNNNIAFYWAGAGTPGDSGSSVLSDDLRAIGVLTHLGAFGAADNGGTHLDRGMQLAADKGGFTHLRLVLAGQDPVAIMNEMRANATVAVKPMPTVPTRDGSGSSSGSNGTTNGTAPQGSGSANGTGDKERPAAVVDSPAGAGAGAPAKTVPGAGPEIAIVLAGIAALAFRRPKTLK